MTPAIILADKNKIPYTLHQYAHQADTKSYGEEAALGLGIGQDQVYKTLILTLDSQASRLAVAMVPVAKQVDLKSFAKAARAKKADMAQVKDAERATGYVLGGISPIGQRKRLPAFLDELVLELQKVYVSAGKRGLQMELTPLNLIILTSAKTAAISR